ncbi:hypothetical protein SMCF_3864, partial [Streptomyces coelicoflavus ZG0656]
ARPMPVPPPVISMVFPLMFMGLSFRGCVSAETQL